MDSRHALRILRLILRHRIGIVGFHIHDCTGEHHILSIDQRLSPAAHPLVHVCNLRGTNSL